MFALSEYVFVYKYNYNKLEYREKEKMEWKIAIFLQEYRDLRGKKLKNSRNTPVSRNFAIAFPFHPRLATTLSGAFPARKNATFLPGEAIIPNRCRRPNHFPMHHLTPAPCNGRSISPNGPALTNSL